jgi:phosphinothricin acetyltransferase
VGVHVRPAEERDIPAINEIQGHYALTTAISFDVEPWSYEARLAWLHEHSSPGPYRAIVAEDGGAVVGWASTSRFMEKVCYSPSVECSVLLRAGWTGRGIGTALYTALFDHVAGEDIHRFYALITVPNEPSFALHERFGFRRIAVLTEVGRKDGRYHDVAWYERPGPAA